jgi:hypothetical protein
MDSTSMAAGFLGSNRASRHVSLTTLFILRVLPAAWLLSQRSTVSSALSGAHTGFAKTGCLVSVPKGLVERAYKAKKNVTLWAGGEKSSNGRGEEKEAEGRGEAKQTKNQTRARRSESETK